MLTLSAIRLNRVSASHTYRVTWQSVANFSRIPKQISFVCCPFWIDICICLVFLTGFLAFHIYFLVVISRKIWSNGFLIKKKSLEIVKKITNLSVNCHFGRHIEADSLEKRLALFRHALTTTDMCVQTQIQISIYVCVFYIYMYNDYFFRILFARFALITKNS